MKKVVGLFGVTFFLISFLPAVDVTSLLGVNTNDVSSTFLLSDVGLRKKQLSELETERDLVAKKADEVSKKIENTLQGIEENIKRTYEALKKNVGVTDELLKKKIVVLNDRKQNLVDLQLNWKEVQGKVTQHIILVRNILEQQQIQQDGREKSREYSWKELEEIKSQIDKAASDIATEMTKVDRLEKLKTSEKEDIVAYKKEIDLKSAERDKKIEESAAALASQSNLISQARARVDLLEQEIELLKEKIEVSEFKIEGLVRDARMKDDEIFIIKYKQSRLQNILRIIQKHLRIDIADIELAKEESGLEAKKTAEEKEKLMREREQLRIKRDELDKSVKTLEQHYLVLKQRGKVKTVDGFLLESKIFALKNEYLVIEKELDAIESKHELAGLSSQFKQAKLQIIEVLHALDVSKEKVDDFHADFKAKKRSAEQSQRVFADKRDEVISNLSTINIELEVLQTRQGSMHTEKVTIFKDRSKEFNEVMNNIKRAIAALFAQKTVVEKHFATLSEVVSLQEDLVNQYGFIVSYIETQKIVNIWTRSESAITPRQFINAFYDGELFLRNLFWMTPSYFSPTALLMLPRQMGWVDYLGLAIFLLLFYVLIILGKVAVMLFAREMRYGVEKIYARINVEYRSAIETLSIFIKDHFIMIFGWLFIFVHVALGLPYFRLWRVPYFSALFYMASIPLLVYLSRQCIDQVRAENKRQHYLLLGEDIEFKVTMLLEIFLYASSILLPLRAAFLHFFDRGSSLPEVLMALYTLITVVLILFLFNKEDMLRLVASKTKFAQWLSTMIDTYYYPVFSFCMLLLMLSNPYVGYSNLAWYLMFAVPTSALLLYGLFFVHYLIRTYTSFFFLEESVDGVKNRFENAKTFYGLLVASSFLLLLFIASVFLLRIWSFDSYSIGTLWESLSHKWVITITDKGDTLGFVELLKLGSFFIGGYVIASLVNKFILGKLFEIFRTERGAQNTISRLTQYAIILVAIMLGFAAINLSQWTLAMGTLLLVGIGFGLQNQIADYFAGLVVLLERPIEIGHYVQSSEYSGKVVKISARATVIKTGCNYFISIPNRDIISKPIKNLGQGRYAVGSEIVVLVGDQVDLERLKNLLLEIARQHPLVLQVPPPIVRFENFDYGILKFYIRVFIPGHRVSELSSVESDVRERIYKMFKQQNIKLPDPYMMSYATVGESDGVGIKGPKGNSDDEE